ncbi:hypothetical protein EGW08_011283 [Elysia chlorotica]|uniref:Uncharacterized protein n=1 Tax=Elysia chlorotica TaxID=188477 RepID=A0A3S1BHP6_ELYCH|nr:hypothetical protein EGW08_011283 [Elysia chlorotica]
MLGTEVRVPVQIPSGADLGHTAEDAFTAAEGFISGDNIVDSTPASPVAAVSASSNGGSVRNSGGGSPADALPNGEVAAAASIGAHSQGNLPENQDPLPSSMFITTHRTSSNNIVITPVAMSAPTITTTTTTTTTDVHEVLNATSSSPTTADSGTNDIPNASVTPSKTFDIATTPATPQTKWIPRLAPPSRTASVLTAAAAWPPPEKSLRQGTMR